MATISPAMQPVPVGSPSISPPVKETVKEPIKKRYGKVGQKWLAQDEDKYIIGLIIGKYFDGKHGLTYCLRNEQKILEVRRAHLLSQVH